MADGRNHIEEVHTILFDLVSRLEEQKGSYPDDKLAELQKYLQAAQNHVRSCRKKVWLRSKEGTEMAQKCLEYAQELQSGYDQSSVAVGAAQNLMAQLESLARLVASKSQVLT